MRLFYFLIVAGVLGTAFMVYAVVTTDFTPYEAPVGSDVFELAEGGWAWSTSPGGCQTDRYAIVFSPDRAEMIITYLPSEPGGDSVSVYDILDHSRSTIRGRIRGEERTTDEGEPVVWDLVLLSPTSFAWRRTDWGELELTAALDRCP